MNEKPRSSTRLAAVFGLIAVILYLPTVGLGFVWDDDLFVARPGWLAQFSFMDGFTNHRWLTGQGFMYYYRPFQFLSHWTDVNLWGLDPAGHHVTNVLFYGMSVGLLGVYLVRTGMGTLGAVAALTWFTFHPTHAEDVSWVAGRPDILATVFTLASMVLLLEARRRDSDTVTLLASLFLLMGFFSKEVAVIFPAAIVISKGLARFVPPEQCGPTDSLPWRMMVLWILPAAVVYAILRVSCPDLVRGYPFGWPASFEELLLVNALNLKILAWHMGSLFLGIDRGPLVFDEVMTLRTHWGGDATRLLALECDLEFALATVAVLGCAAWILVRGLRSPDRFPLLLLIGSLVVSLNLTNPRSQVNFAERYLFVPSLGLALVLARRGEILRKLSVPIRGALFAGWIVLGLSGIGARSVRYRSDAVFWQRAVRANPASAMARANRGVVRMRRGDLEGARQDLEMSVGLWPGRRPLLNLLRVLVALERFDRLEVFLDRHGTLLERMARGDAEFLESLAADPQVPEAVRNRLKAYLEAFLEAGGA